MGLLRCSGIRAPGLVAWYPHGLEIQESFLVYLLARSDFSFFTGADGGQVDPRALIERNVSVVNQTTVPSGFGHLPPLQGVLSTKGLSASVCKMQEMI